MILKNVRSCFVGLKRRQPYRQNGGSTRRGYRPITFALFILVVVVTFSSPRVKRTEENNRNKKSFREALVSILNCHGVILCPNRLRRKLNS